MILSPEKKVLGVQWALPTCWLLNGRRSFTEVSFTQSLIVAVFDTFDRASVRPRGEVFERNLNHSFGIDGFSICYLAIWSVALDLNLSASGGCVND